MKKEIEKQHLIDMMKDDEELVLYEKCIEDAIKERPSLDLENTANAFGTGFRIGAKYKQERMYTEEDMAESFMACWKANVSDGNECKLSFKEWFEQFKKK